MVNTSQTRKAGKAKNAFTLIEIMIVVLIIGILLAIAVPNFVRARESARAKSCVANLKALDGAKEQFMMTNNWRTDSALGYLELAHITNDYLKTRPICPSGGNYSFSASPINTLVCSVGGTAGDPLAHVIP